MAAPTIQQILDQAIQLHKAGRLAEAEQLYQRILSKNPQHADSIHYLGVIAYQKGNFDAAVELIRKAIALRPNYPDAYNSLGIVCFEQARFDEAIAAYRHAIAFRPNYAEALGNLGMTLGKQGLLDEAVSAFRHSIAIQPRFPEAHSGLGIVLKKKGLLDEALAEFRQAIALRPNFAQGHFNLGILLADMDQWPDSISAFRAAIALNPASADAHYHLGNALRSNRQIDEAVAAYRKAIALDPKNPQSHVGLGNALGDKDQVEAAIAEYREAILLKPDYARAYNNLGIALRKKGRLDEAIAAYRRAIALEPNEPAAHLNLGNALDNIARFDEAVSSYQNAIALNPNYAEAHCNLSSALRNLCRLEESAASARRAIALKPDHVAAYSNLGNVLKDLGQIDQALSAYRQAISLQPDDAQPHSNLLLTLHYQPSGEIQSIAEEHRRWNAQHALPLRPSNISHGNDRGPDRPLRIGYVSADFCSHSVAYFFENLLAFHDQQSVQTFCYSNLVRADEVTHRLRQHAGQWREIAGSTNSEAAELIRRDHIDILVDLSGHTAGNRLLVFARKPAPIQVTYLGYPDTTGMTAIDYRLTDHFADPPGQAESLHSEKLMRLPRTFLCYRPNENGPAVAALPASSSGHVVFGSFNALAKMNGPLVKMWSRILREVPNSRMILKNLGLASAAARQWLRGLFIAEGIDAERIEVLGPTPDKPDHLQLYGRMDVALDTYPYHGTTTTCEAMWMGVPTVTLAGPAHASRVGVSLLSNLGLPELVAESEEQYVRLAGGIANDLSRLIQLRSTLRRRMEKSPLMDAAQFARDVEAAYRRMWQAWCADRPASV